MCARFVGQATRKAGRKLGLVAPPRATSAASHLEEVTRHFGRTARAWQQLYQLESLEPRMIRERQALALRWAESLPLVDGARVLEVGCGAGLAAVALARRGLRVHAIDIAPEMVDLAVEAARSAGVRQLTCGLGDVHALELGDETFDLVLALGLLPWLHDEALGLKEMARVLRPGGRLIASADNRAPLHRLLDPRATPSIAPLRATAKRLLRRAGAHDPAPVAKRHEARELDGLLRAAGLEPVESATVGFGPFSLLGRRLLGERGDLVVHESLQTLADWGWPIVGSRGVHLVVLAQKPRQKKSGALSAGQASRV
jgi:2-polyprenyl-6-hydroxyphenyl methylase/3-demethylubiquinone-9 3-methyltransferase